MRAPQPSRPSGRTMTFHRSRFDQVRHCGWIRPAVAAAGIAFHTHAVAAARLEGQVRLTPMPAAPVQAAMNPYAGTLGSICNGTSTFTPQVSDVRDVVVQVEGVPATASAPAPGHPSMAQQGQSFQPRVLGILVGTTVDFPNRDPIFHNVFSYSKTKRFDLGKYGRGKSASVTFDKPGLVKIFCDIHSNMTGFVYVTATPWVVQPDDQGRFALDGIPDGTYTLRLWHPERGTHTEMVTVAAAGTHVDLQF